MEDIIRKSSDAGPVQEEDDFFAAGAFEADLAALEAKKKEDAQKAGNSKTFSSIREESTAKLQALQEKMNLGRAAAKEAREHEAKAPKPGPETAAREEIRDAKAREKHFYETIAAQGEDPDRFWRLQQTQEAVQRRGKNEKRKRENEAIDRTSTSLSSHHIVCLIGFRASTISYKRKLFHFLCLLPLSH